MATGSEDGTVNIWSIEKLTLEGVLILQNKIVNIGFSPIHPIMMVAEETGLINFFFIRPYENLQERNHCFAKIQYTDSCGIPRRIKSLCLELVINAYLQGVNSPIKGSDGNHQLLCVVGGEDGSIRIANVSRILTSYNVEQNHQICLLKKSVKCEIHSLRSTIATEKKKILVQGYSNENVELTLFQDFTEAVEW